MNERFIVPQFIDAEDKIFGPVTVRQFIIVIIGFLFIFIAYKLSDFALFALEAFIITSVTLLFAFVKFNGAPFHVFFGNFLNTFTKAKIRVWMKEYIAVAEFKSKNEEKKEEYIKPKPLANSGKLSELSLIIDTGGMYKGEINRNDFK